MDFDFTIFMIPIITAFCYWIGSVIKQTKKIDDNYIPLIVFVSGIVLGVLSYFFDLEGFTPKSVLTGAIYGGISGGLSTWVNQVVKQLSKGK